MLFTAPPQGMVTAYPQVGQYERVRGRKGENERVIRESLDEQVGPKTRDGHAWEVAIVFTGGEGGWRST
jgi:hypothetical protein